MQCAREQRLAGAGLAGQEHGRAALREQRDLGLQGAHGRTVGDEIRAHGPVDAAPQFLVVAEHILQRQRPLEAESQLVEFERLLQEVGSAKLHRLDGMGDVAVCRHQQHDHARVERLDPCQHGETVKPWHA